MIYHGPWYRKAQGPTKKYRQLLAQYYNPETPIGELGSLIVAIWTEALHLGILPELPFHVLWVAARLLPKEVGGLMIKVRHNSNDFRRPWQEIPLPEMPEFISHWALTEGEDWLWGASNFDWYPGMKESPQVHKGMEETVEWLEIDVLPQWLKQVKWWNSQMDSGRFKQ